MRISRFIYYLFSLAITIAIMCYTFINPMYQFSGYIIIIGIISLNFVFKKNDKNNATAILMRYTGNCDPQEYINELKSYTKKCIFTKRQKLIYDLYYAVAYLDNGEFDKAKSLLLNLDANEKYLDEITLIVYLKAWSDYFFFNYDDVKMKEVLLKMKDIIVKTKNINFRNNYSFLYGAQEAKYYILTGENLDSIRDLFLKRQQAIPTVLSYVNNSYLIGLIDLRKKDFTEALKSFKKLNESKKNIYVVRKGKEIYHELCNKMKVDQ